jgi:hypothetical protein
MAQGRLCMFQSFFNKRKIKKYAKNLPQDLKENYAYQKHYSKEQVDASLKRKRLVGGGGVAVTDNCYAYAMFCSPEEFNDIHEGTGETCDYESMRSDVSDTIFNSASDFSFSTFLVNSGDPDASSFSGSGSSSFSDSGDSGYSGSDGGGSSSD